VSAARRAPRGCRLSKAEPIKLAPAPLDACQPRPPACRTPPLALTCPWPCVRPPLGPPCPARLAQNGAARLQAPQRLQPRTPVPTPFHQRQPRLSIAVLRAFHLPAAARLPSSVDARRFLPFCCGNAKASVPDPAPAGRPAPGRRPAAPAFQTFHDTPSHGTVLTPPPCWNLPAHGTVLTPPPAGSFQNLTAPTRRACCKAKALESRPFIRGGYTRPRQGQAGRVGKASGGEKRQPREA
jgi:hypothetical protein